MSTQNLHTDVYSRFIHNLPKLGSNQHILQKVTGQTVVHPYYEILFSKKRNLTIKGWKDTKKSCKHIAKWKKPIWKDYN